MARWTEMISSKSGLSVFLLVTAFSAAACADRGPTTPSASPSSSTKPALQVTPGAYTLTVVSDPSATGHQRAECAGFPADLLRRTYDASVGRSPYAPTEDEYWVVFSSPTITNPPGASCFVSAAFPVARGCFAFEVVGQLVRFELQNGWGWDWVEEWPGFRYLTIEGYSGSEPARTTETSLTMPFDGSFEYCELKSAMVGNANCHQVPADQIVEYRSCSSPRDTIVLTKR
jgi:hypothetical protein